MTIAIIATHVKQSAAERRLSREGPDRSALDLFQEAYAELKREAKRLGLESDGSFEIHLSLEVR